MNNSEQHVDAGDASQPYSYANYPSITSVPMGFAVSWTDQTHKCVARYSQQGDPTSGPSCIPEPGAPVLVGLQNNDVVALAGTTARLQHASGQWSEPFAIASSPTDSLESLSGAALADGTWYAAWIAHQVPASGYQWEVRIRHFASDGTALGSDQDVTTVSGTGGFYASSIGALKDGSFVVAWMDTNREMLARRYAPDGAPLTGVFDVGSSGGFAYQPSNVVGLAGGGFVVVYEGQVAPVAQVFAADGSKVGGPVAVDTPPDISSQTCGMTAQGPIPCVQVDLWPKAAALADGGFVVSWNVSGRPESSVVQARRFNADGSPAGATTQVSAQTSMARPTTYYPGVAALPNGNFAFAWQYNQGQPTGIFFRAFDATGLK